MGVGGLDPVQALLGASLIGSAIGLVLAPASGQFIDPRGPWGGIMRLSQAHLSMRLSTHLLSGWFGGQGRYLPLKWPIW